MNQNKLIKDNLVKNIDKYDTIVKVVKSNNDTSAKIYLPKKYINKEVIILIEK